jgi:predicted site-specific integrase-resolvase
MTHEQSIRELLARTDRLSVLSGDGWLPLPVAAEVIGVSCTTLRRWHDEGRAAPLRIRQMHARRGKLQVELASLAAYKAAVEKNS